jgi:putative membrane protein
VKPEDRLPGGLLAVWVGLCAVSGVAPRDRVIWVMEVLPVWLALAALIPTYRRFPLTPLLYLLIFVHACVLTLGAKYTYAEVPLGFWVQGWLDLPRNPYDGLGHFFQGFVPVVVVREVLLRTSPLRPGKWLGFLACSVCLAASALYELIEWWVAITREESADAFLGAQGDVWDTQKDMALCLLGSLLGLLAFSRLQDRQLAARGLADSPRDAPAS